jgi:hypothetical protein
LTVDELSFIVDLTADELSFIVDLTADELSNPDLEELIKIDISKDNPLIRLLGDLSQAFLGFGPK